jgi:hypothetical protein
MLVFDFRVFDCNNISEHGNEPVTVFFSINCELRRRHRRTKIERHYSTLIVYYCN